MPRKLANRRCVPRKRIRSKPLRTPMTWEPNRCRNFFMAAFSEGIIASTTIYSRKQPPSSTHLVAATPRWVPSVASCSFVTSAWRSAPTTDVARFDLAVIAADDVREFAGRHVIVPAVLFVVVHVEGVEWLVR